MKLAVFTTGGTIDKIYFDQKSNYEVGDAVVGPLLQSMAVGFDFAVEELMKIDSLDMTDAQRSHIVERVSASPLQHVLITHGTDGMIETARALSGVEGKTIVLTGALRRRLSPTTTRFSILVVLSLLFSVCHRGAISL